MRGARAREAHRPAVLLRIPRTVRSPESTPPLCTVSPAACCHVGIKKWEKRASDALQHAGCKTELLCVYLPVLHSFTAANAHTEVQTQSPPTPPVPKQSSPCLDRCVCVRRCAHRARRVLMCCVGLFLGLGFFFQRKQRGFVGSCGPDHLLVRLEQQSGCPVLILHGSVCVRVCVHFRSW